RVVQDELLDVGQRDVGAGLGVVKAAVGILLDESFRLGRGSAVPCHDHPMCRPPFREKSAPVAKPESSEASQATIEPISSGVPRRLTGMVATIFSSTSGRMARTMSVPM